MGRKDTCTTNYFEDNFRFADFINGSIFHGRRIILPENLKEANKEMLSKQKSDRRRVIRDNVKKYYKNTVISVLVLEHQQNVDYHMVIRNMLSEAMEYDRQWHETKRLHRKNGDLKTGNEFVSGMCKEDKFIPVITLVVYYGREKWDASLNLYDILNMEDTEPELLKYINNYSVNIFDYHNYDNFDMFASELRQVFSFLKYSEDKEKLQKYIAENSADFYNISDESVELMAVLTNSEKILDVDRFRNEEGGIDMCKALEDIRQEGIGIGIEQGLEQGIRALIINNIQEGISKERTIKSLQKLFGLEQDAAEAYYNDISNE